jgi:hypothetical protein
MLPSRSLTNIIVWRILNVTLSTVFSPLIPSSRDQWVNATAQKLSLVVAYHQGSTILVGAIRRFLRFPFVPVSHDQEAGDE